MSAKRRRGHPLSVREIRIEQQLEQEVEKATARILRAVRKAFERLEKQAPSTPREQRLNTRR